MFWAFAVTVPLVAGAVGWWRAGRQSPERIHAKRGQNFGPDQFRDHVEQASVTYGTGRKGRYSR